MASDGHWVLFKTVISPQPKINPENGTRNTEQGIKKTNSLLVPCSIPPVP
jgi:hypothetical protein